MSEQEYYDDRFARGRKKITFRERIFRHIFSNIFRDMKLDGPVRILELGCGQGRLASFMSGYGSVVAYDMAAGTIEDNKKLYGQVDFQEGDGRYPAERCDLQAEVRFCCAITLLAT